METNLRILPSADDRISFLYIEYAKIERQDFALIIIQKDSKVLVPISTINVLLLGPGTSITHGAVNIIAASGCNIVWCGDHATRFYSFDAAEIRNSKNLLKQIDYFSNESTKINIIKKMYKKRYSELEIDKLTLKELRGYEGVKVKETYKFYSKLYKVPWKFRNSKLTIFEEQDLINKIITVLNQMLYAICHSIILSIGFSPSIGFIHTGNIESFTFDIADLYKENIVIPLAFSIYKKINTDNFDFIIRSEFRKIIVDKQLIKTIVKDIFSLFRADKEGNEISVNVLWDFNELLEGNKNYGDEL